MLGCHRLSLQIRHIDRSTMLLQALLSAYTNPRLLPEGADIFLTAATALQTFSQGTHDFSDS